MRNEALWLQLMNWSELCNFFLLWFFPKTISAFSKKKGGHISGFFNSPYYYIALYQVYLRSMKIYLGHYGPINESTYCFSTPLYTYHGNRKNYGDSMNLEISPPHCGVIFSLQMGHFWGCMENYNHRPSVLWGAHLAVFPVYISVGLFQAIFSHHMARMPN